jgi:hypothetical protein
MGAVRVEVGRIYNIMYRDMKEKKEPCATCHDPYDIIDPHELHKLREKEALYDKMVADAEREKKSKRRAAARIDIIDDGGKPVGKKPVNISLGLSIIAMLIAVATLIYVSGSGWIVVFPNLEFIVSFMAVIVTVYVAVQIYNSVTLLGDVKSEVGSYKKEVVSMTSKMIANLEDNINEDIDERMKQRSHDMAALCHLAYAHSVHLSECPTDETGFSCAIKALKESNLSDKKEYATGIMRALLCFIKDCESDYIDDNEIVDYIVTIEQSKHYLAESLVKTIKRVRKDRLEKEERYRWTG